VIVAIGDVHGKFGALWDVIKGFDSFDPIDFVQVGDFGLGFDGPEKEHRKLRDFSNVLESAGHRLWVIRGNHDNPIYWNPSFSHEINRINFVEDGSLIEIDGRHCFFSGGATSIDRTNRKKAVSYWPEEIFKDPIPVIPPERIDVVFTHDVFLQCSPFTIDSPTTEYWFERDPTLREEILRTQRYMSMFYQWVMDINDGFSWYHGHYHKSCTTINGNQKTHCLAELETKEVV